MTSLSYSCRSTIRFSDADPAGILFFGRVFELAHAALESFVQDSGIGWDNWYSSQEWIVPIVNAQADFKSPMKAGESAVVDVRVLQIGKSSCTFEFMFSTGQKTNAVVRTTHVFASKSACVPVPIPEAIRTVLSLYMKPTAS